MAGPISEERVWAELGQIADPEIPVLSLVELGVIREVEVGDDVVRVALRPTFAGCPALHVMRAQIGERLRALGAAKVEVRSCSILPVDGRHRARGPSQTGRLRTGTRAFSGHRAEDILTAPRLCLRCAVRWTRNPQRLRADPAGRFTTLGCMQPFER
jgi:phenylacetate-CoA oxygenase PaaJ subunit